MRLLDARTLELVDVVDNNVPRYAILSHTWGDEEVTIQRLRRLGGCSQLSLASPQTLDKKRRATVLKKGYIKISGAAQLAVSRGLDYLWVDTCCIDKTSSAELSEAINSMYLWYEQSAECYAFLADVEPPNDAHPDAFHENLRRSRWFTRGWTLQELIAPKLVLFYAKDWTLLGQKDAPANFTKIISEISNIDRDVLDGRIDPLQLSVSARMAWASHRNTTRLEDTAYCLMGLFQVNMPLLYGEGRRAFTRLQEEIIQRTDDQSIFAWNSFDDEDEDPDALFGLLAQSPAQFKHAGSLQVLPPLPVYASAPSVMTNQGLRVQLYLEQRPYSVEGVMEEDFFAILDCVQRERDVYQCPALLLRRLSEDQYGRLEPKSQHFMPPPSSTYWPNEGYRSVYVRQQPVYYHLPQFRLSPLNVESGLGSSDGVQYRLLDKYPAHNWNSATMTLKVHYSRKLQAMGIFRFQSIDKTHEKVDVVVGLRRLNTMEWEGWCFQLSYRDRSLEQAFHEVNKRIERELARSSSDEMTSQKLRDSLGEDSSLTSSATVEGIQLQGRLYISILVSLTAELQTYKELDEMPSQVMPLSKSSNSSTSADSDVRALTELYCCTTGSPFALDDYGSNAWVVPPVRSRYSEDGTGTARGDFMKPLYDFTAFLKEKSPVRESRRRLSATEQLAEASFAGDASQVEAILAYQTPNIETRTTDQHGFAPLHWAVAGGSHDCIMLLLRNGADPKALTKRGLLAIHVAVLCNNKAWTSLDKFHAQPELGHLANARTEHFFETPLHMAAASSPDTEYGVSFFKQLLDWSWEHTGLAPRNKFDETPLHRAAAGNCVGAVRALYRYGCHLDAGDRYGRTPIWHAAAAGSRNAIAALIQLGASVSLTDDLGRSPLHAACRGGHREVVALLLQHGARTDTEVTVLNMLPMDLAAMFGFVECLNELFQGQHQEPTQAHLDRALRAATSYGRYDCVRLLCRQGANPFAVSEYYLRSEPGRAVVVEAVMDAYCIALAQEQSQIADFFDTSETCKYHRDVRFPPADNVSNDRNDKPAMANPMPSFSTPAGPPPTGAAPLPPGAVSAPAFAPGSSLQYQPVYGNAPTYSSPAYGSHGNAPQSGPAYSSWPSHSSPANAGPPYGVAPSYGNYLSNSSPYTSQQGPPQYQSASRCGSASLPAHTSNAYTSVPPMPPTQSQRLQELVNPYEPLNPDGSPYTYQPDPSSSGTNTSLLRYVEAPPRAPRPPERRVSVL
ncbi:hypothetical protein M440DRAFT_1399860 [Trichoderma longibrachiatum ATCC 18648]|uniref:Uncharacterized protein n=1 Tax=Trichoderma longibrachiatum ATCC 18648 TaxID=983965 RepID=A0A2T4CB37_TRILO|nr:hypothetical protein M440DRAFT_1399860 [Trichoderma longibrachiatum ATCC 18648]